MKKFASLGTLAVAALIFAFASCSNGSDTQLAYGALDASNPAATGGTDGTGSPTTTPGGTPGTDTSTTIPGGATGTDVTGGITVDDGTVTINSSKLIFIGDDTETIDGVEYKVKKYAQLVIDDNPYFYTYYKLYYLNNKLRRFYSFDHGMGSDMDYKYDEFVEHFCGDNEERRNIKLNDTSFASNIASSPFKIYTYYEDGKIESRIPSNLPSGVLPETLLLPTLYYYVGYYSSSLGPSSEEWYTKRVNEYYSNGTIKTYRIYSCPTTSDLKAVLNGRAYWNSKIKIAYHENGKVNELTKYGYDGVIEESKTLCTYYDNGRDKATEIYSNGKLSSKKTYYENGRQESSVTYAADGVTEASKTLYTYYDNGKNKEIDSYSNGKLSSKITYYDNGNENTEESYSNEKLSSKKTYNEENGCPKTYETYTEGELTSRITYYYNSEYKSRDYDPTYTPTYTRIGLNTIYNDHRKTLEEYSAGKLTSKTTYREDGRFESSVDYNVDGITEIGKTLYTYYDNGNQKTYERYANGKLKEKLAYHESGNDKKTESYDSDGKLTSVYIYYDGKAASTDGYLTRKTKLSANYASYSTRYLSSISYYYSSGYLKYYYSGIASGGSFYTYADNKTKTSSTDSSVYSTKEDYTQEQAETKLAELLNE